MPRYSANFLRWADYFAGPAGAPPDDEGLAQFHEYESRGVRPAEPTPYFLRLAGGRSMFNALQKTVRESYGTPEWQGIAADREAMPDWLFRAFYGWHPVVRDAG
jgi:hypothetical protein